jgi:hypothetical protein
MFSQSNSCEFFVVATPDAECKVPNGCRNTISLTKPTKSEKLSHRGPEKLFDALREMFVSWARMSEKRSGIESAWRQLTYATAAVAFTCFRLEWRS